ncbi:PilZ domain-containing protein [Novosphingobium sp. SL115]|uniref:PilZ domain-containing protein n=1 Tax=Novosphingobium sp. SL115 TaxID=2995150 RepID=UPI0022753980|nr:PilZ domain-containing protein [Novosphingobium sp. SL115]MCY1672404.1 PilZ domain-containing protein [Novosphingobium sp. SL115]
MKHFLPPSGTLTGKRAAARVRLHLPARVELLTGTQKCFLEDLSVSGAAIIPRDRLPRIGDSVVVICNPIDAFGVVVWARHGRFGVSFDEPLPMTQVIALRHVADDFADSERERFREEARAWVQGRA